MLSAAKRPHDTDETLNDESANKRQKVESDNLIQAIELPKPQIEVKDNGGWPKPTEAKVALPEEVTRRRSESHNVINRVKRAYHDGRIPGKETIKYVNYVQHVVNEYHQTDFKKFANESLENQFHHRHYSLSIGDRNLLYFVKNVNKKSKSTIEKINAKNFPTLWTSKIVELMRGELKSVPNKKNSIIQKDCRTAAAFVGEQKEQFLRAKQWAIAINNTLYEFSLNVEPRKAKTQKSSSSSIRKQLVEAKVITTVPVEAKPIVTEAAVPVQAQVVAPIPMQVTAPIAVQVQNALPVPTAVPVPVSQQSAAVQVSQAYWETGLFGDAEFIPMEDESTQQPANSGRWSPSSLLS
jgi:hypothetical protein